MLTDLNESKVLATHVEQVLRASLVVLFASSFLISGFLFVKPKIPPIVENILCFLARSFYLWGIACLGASLSTSMIQGQESQVTVLGVCLVLSIFALSIERSSASVQFPSIVNCLAAALIWFIVLLTIGFLPSAKMSPTTLLVKENGLFSEGLAMVHVVSALVGEGLCVVAFCSSILYLWIYNKLKRKPKRFPYPLPSIQTLDRATDNMVLVGWFLMTISLLSGFILVLETGSAPFLKILWACTVWLWYLVTVLGRSALGWRGRRGAVLAVFGALLLVVPLFGSIWAEEGTYDSL